LELSSSPQYNIPADVVAKAPITAQFFGLAGVELLGLSAKAGTSAVINKDTFAVKRIFFEFFSESSREES
jgi:hypothetical protein